MAKIDQFKDFIRKNPSLINKVNNNTTTWQKLYEIWDLYGENNEVWNNYVETRSNNNRQELGLKDIMDNFKNVNVDSIVKGLNGLQKILATAQEFFGKGDGTSQTDSYIPRPIHKRFDD